MVGRAAVLAHLIGEATVQSDDTLEPSWIARSNHWMPLRLARPFRLRRPARTAGS